MKLFGVITALVTPMNSNGSVDYSSLKKLIRFQIKGGIKNILILGTTGESNSLNNKEKIVFLKKTIKYVNKKANIIVGSNSNNTKKCIKFNEKISNYDIKCILQSVPSYLCPSQNGIYIHLKKISKKSKKPLIIYDIEKRNGVCLTIENFKKLLKLKNIIGIKKSSFSYNEYISFILLSKEYKKNFYCGDDLMSFFSYCLGASGSISVISNIIPDKCTKMYDLINKNLIFKARKIFFYIKKIIDISFLECNPSCIKYILHLKRLSKKFVREPLSLLKKKSILFIRKNLNING